MCPHRSQSAAVAYLKRRVMGLNLPPYTISNKQTRNESKEFRFGFVIIITMINHNYLCLINDISIDK